VKVSPALRATIGLGFTQIVGWGTTFLMPSVLGRHMEDDLGIAREIVFSAAAASSALIWAASPCRRASSRPPPRR